MKHITIYLLLASCFFCCEDLDVTPKTAISTGNFFTNAQELEIGINALYDRVLWKVDLDLWSDDGHHRGGAFLNNDIGVATLNAESNISGNYWRDLYDGIKRANTLLENMPAARENVPTEVYNRIEGEARAIRAYFYGILVTKFGGVPLITTSLQVNESLQVIRASQEEVKQFVYTELEEAANLLPNSNENRATKGFALGIKARFALYLEDYTIALDAAKRVIDLGIYGLDPNFSSLFLKESADSPELIYFVPHSFELNVTYNEAGGARGIISRNSGGFGAFFPTWEAVHIFECTDGLPIDESPLYDPHDPFSNRDPRMTQTIVEFGSEWLGYIYEPHPDSVTTLNTTTGTIVNNNDTRGRANFASFTGMLWKKGVEQSWSTNRAADRNLIILRYADILLMYAEALIELNQDLGIARDAINQVRARAYANEIFPAVTEDTQADLRIRLRRERRMELMFEGLRYQDIIRWQIAKKALDRIVLGLPNPTDQDRSQWPFTNTILPEVDDDGVVIFDANNLISNNFARTLQDYDFDESRMYLWPIPAADRLLNTSLSQNPGY